ncbi:MAG: 50S ribosomal protein L5 [Puniceicoccales bacterium]|jgi:large subunit ribosomal protein L5|nr:50S ribosomal protein L5 [Puniceicoccales bacterium]
MAVGKSELEVHYESVVRERLREKYGYGNVHEIPALVKIAVNSAISSSSDKSAAEEVGKEVAALTGQKPVIVRTKKSISNFKLRAGMPNGVKVTLRGRIMYHFFCRLVKIALPMIRDFRGLPARFDGRGNYTLGIGDHSIFPEISVDRERSAIGMDITFVTSAKTDAEGRDLLEFLGVPFVRHGSGSVQPSAAA